MNLHKITIEPLSDVISNGTKVFIDGVQVKGLRAISVEGEIDSIWSIVLKIDAEIDWQKPQPEGTA